MWPCLSPPFPFSLLLFLLGSVDQPCDVWLQRAPLAVTITL